MITELNNMIGSTNWFNARYKDGLTKGKRFHTMKAALTLFIARGGGNIVETGCQRLEDDWGAGCSTKVFSEVIDKTKLGHLYSIDNSRVNLSYAQSIVPMGSSTFILDDSIAAIGKLPVKTIELLYLDSFDYPDGEVVERHRERIGRDISYEDSMINLSLRSNESIHTEFGDLIAPCQRHQVSELSRAQDMLHDNSIILLDDYDLPGEGKCGTSHEWLYNKGYIPIIVEYQSLWIKG